jgi:hypothetical protein
MVIFYGELIDDGNVNVACMRYDIGAALPLRRTTAKLNGWHANGGGEEERRCANWPSSVVS